MKLKQGSTLFLKIVIGLIAISAFVAMLWFPQTEGRATDLDLISIYSDPFIIYLYIATIPFFLALYQAYVLLGYVDQHKVFSPAAVKAVEKIKYSAFAIIGFLAAALVYVFSMSTATNEDGAGAIVVGAITIFAASVIATAVAVFQKLLQNAVDIKSENDLTV